MNKIYVTGLGPGAEDQMTIRARKVLEHCPVIIGYTVYIDLIRDLFPGKVFLSTPMRREADRCRMAFEEAEKGQDVAIVCSGDAGIYGMAGLICEIGKEYPQTEIEIFKIIQMNLIEIKQTVRNSLQIIQYITTVNTVTITQLYMQSSPFTRPIIKVTPYPPIELLLLKVITDPRHYSQKTVTRKQTVVFEFLTIRNSVRSTITQQKRID